MAVIVDVYVSVGIAIGVSVIIGASVSFGSGVNVLATVGIAFGVGVEIRGGWLFSTASTLTTFSFDDWFELNGQITGKLTESRALWLVSRELTMIRDEKIINDQNVRDHDYEKKLESLIPNESVDALLELWDENLVSEDDMYDAWEMNSFKKWVWKK